MALAKGTGEQPHPPVRANGPREFKELHFCFAKPQFSCEGPARAKKFATTAEAMIANWVQRFKREALFRKKLVVQRRRGDRACKGAAGANETFCGEER